MTYIAGLNPADMPPLTIWEALKMAEDRKAYATIMVEAQPDVRIHVFNGRLLSLDESGQSIDLVQTIANVLGARYLCTLVALCDVPDAQDKPTVPIAESLVAAVRLNAASATLAYDAEKAGDSIVATTFGQAYAEKDTAPAIEVENIVDDRKSEADRMREEFFERRARRRGTAPAPGIAAAVGSLSLPSPVAPSDRRRSPGPSDRRASDKPGQTRPTGGTKRVTSEAEPRTRRATDHKRAVAADGDPAVDPERESRPTQRTALRSLIRNLISS